MKRVAAMVLVLMACQRQPETATSAVPAPPPPLAGPTHESEIRQWQTNRVERLKKEDSWLTLIGLHWLKDGQNTVELTKVGTQPLKIDLHEGKTTLHAVEPMTIDGKPAGGAVVLADDTSEKGPTIVQMGSVRFNIIKRGDRFGVRVKDAEAMTRTQFAGLEYFPIDPKWQVEARLEPYNPPKKIAITDVTGMTSDNAVPGALVFTVAGKEHRLDPILEEGSSDYFIIFKDETSRDSTYPAGRYLYASPPGPDGKVIVDFNKAYNPPCAFTPFATCPLPPVQNRLPVRIEAGEKKYGDGHA